MFENVGDTLQGILETIYPISYSCYEGIFEFYVIVLGYYFTILDPNMLLYNAIHNFGDIYDDIGALIKLFTKIENTETVWWKDLGYAIGDFIHQLLFQPADYNPYSG